MRFYLAVFFAVIFAIESPAATNDKSPTNGTESLGGKLLDDLSPDTAHAASKPKKRRARRKSKIR